MERGFRATKRFYLLLFISLALLVLFVVGAIYLMNRVTGNVRKLEQLTLYTEVECEAVVVRSERLIPSDFVSESRILLEDGALVSEGDPIAVLYPYSYESQIAAICTREAAIYTRLQSLLRSDSGTGALPAEVVQYNDQIGAVSREMRAAAIGEGDPGSYAALELRLVKLQEGRRNVMFNKLSDTSKEMVRQSIADLDELKKNFETGSASTIVSEYNGYISFYSDNKEESLRDVSQLTVRLIRGILRAPSISNDDMDNENFSYRIVTDRSKFYLAFVQNANSADRLMPGLTYYFTIKGVSGAYQGRIITERDSADGVLYVMQVDADVRPVLTTRVVEISIQNNATGLYVPVRYLQFTDGVPYIYVKSTDGSFQKIAVYIAGSDGKNAIVSAHDSNISLFAGLKVRIPPDEEE